MRSSHEVSPFPSVSHFYDASTLNVHIILGFLNQQLHDGDLHTADRASIDPVISKGQPRDISISKP